MTMNNIKSSKLLSCEASKLLLTGSGGFIGSNLKRHLQYKYNLLTPRSYELDLTDKSAVEKYFQDNEVDFIIHCGSIGGARGIEDSATTIKDNVAMVENLISAKKDDVRIILFGSGAMYGKSRKLHKVREEEIGEFTPEDLYGLSKLKISDIVKKRDDILMLNIFGCYGYGEKESRFPTYAITQNLKHEPIVINNDVIFDYLFVEDMSRIVEYFIIHKNYDKIINITPSESISLVEIARGVNAISDFKSDIVVKSVNPNGEYTGCNKILMSNYPNLEFTPINTGLEKLYNYIKSRSLV